MTPTYLGVLDWMDITMIKEASNRDCWKMPPS
jgi:hypothetical protein